MLFAYLLFLYFAICRFSFSLFAKNKFIFFKKSIDSPLKRNYIRDVMKTIINKIKLAVADSKLGGFLFPIYKITYQPKDKEAQEYITSRPFGKFKDGITTYCYGKGIRSFRYDRILNREVVKFRATA